MSEVKPPAAPILRPQTIDEADLRHRSRRAVFVFRHRGVCRLRGLAVAPFPNDGRSDSVAVSTDAANESTRLRSDLQQCSSHSRIPCRLRPAEASSQWRYGARR